ncbi:hypothetical protein K440DRAFT_634906 [Wilcoxina mikolae CBS 423.85]|nr:hypothetical protein K440DRAFT_634906 [Wilcoxina mikolae CBS 423.85]
MANKSLLPYKPIATEFLGDQKVIDLSDCAYWRNNLVAASKYHNYLFIAVRSHITVHIPTFPYQTLPETPYTILTSDPLVPSRGVIDRQNPHAINSLTIGDLGSEEVLVSAHDDGDVCVWYTRNLKRMALRLSVGQSAWGVALHKEKRLLAVSANSHLITVFELAVEREELAEKEERDRRGELSDDDDEEIVTTRTEGDLSFDSVQRRRKKRPSLGENDDEEDGRKVGCEECERLARDGRKRRKEKSHNDKSIKTLTGHENNIPSISFLDDSSGRWLVGTDIDGYVILWDVHTQRMVEKCRLGFINRGWSVVFLTPQSFKPTNNIYEALDKSPNLLPRRSRYHVLREDLYEDLPPREYVSGIRCIPTGYYDTPTANQPRTNEARAWDISPVTSRAGRTMTHDRLDIFGSDFGPPEDIQALQAHLAQEDGSLDEDDHNSGVLDGSSSPAPLSPLPIPTVPTPPPGDGPDHYQGDGSETSSSLQYQDLLWDEGHLDVEASSWHTDSEDQLSEDEDEDSDGQDDLYEGEVLTSIPAPIQTRQYSEPPTPIAAAQTCKNHHHHNNHHNHYHIHRQEENDDEEPEPAQPPMSFIFSTTEYNAYLFPTTYLSPTVFCNSFLQQHFPPGLQFLSQIDRLNMALPIPELSLIVIASQQGRAAIFRLTRSGDHFGMRLDTVLPREHGDSEMDLETRPPVALLGIAVSPIQGKEMGKSRAGSDTMCGIQKRKERQRGGGWRGVETRRRWRLMMVYTDGTVLSYELGRETEEEGPGGLGDLLGLDGFIMV